MISAVLYAKDNSVKMPLFVPANLTPDPDYLTYPKLENNTPIFNYAAFFKNGMNMFDNNLKIGDENNYYGYIGNIEKIILTAMYEDYLSISNGITIVFDRYSCNKIDVYIDDKLVCSIENENGLPLETFIDMEVEYTAEKVTIEFSGYPENAYVTLKGLILGKVVEINKFFSFDSIAEIKPLGDDLPINEANFEVLLENDVVVEEGQNIKIYGGDTLYENDFVVSSTNEQKNRYSFKTRSEIDILDKGESIAFYIFSPPSTDWSVLGVYASDMVDTLIDNAEYPNFFKHLKLSPFLKPQSKRKMLQQIAWATGCGIDTTESEKIKFIPFKVSEIFGADITINNSDARTKSIKLERGKKYSRIVCEIPKYTKSSELVELGDMQNVEWVETAYSGEFKSNEPFWAERIDGVDAHLSYRNPYYVNAQYESPAFPKVYGYKYTKSKEDYVIEIGKRGIGDTLVITNQELYPIDMGSRINDLRVWYAHNNTIKATLVDNGDLKIGKVIDIELLSGGRFFGIITKIDRNNIADKHLVDLEAHEWNIYF